MSKGKKMTKTEAKNESAVSVSDEQKASISAAEQEIVRAKLALADLDIRRSAFEKSHSEAISNYEKVSKAYVAAVMDAAKSNGIDIEDKSVRWNFDTTSFTFTRQG